MVPQNRSSENLVGALIFGRLFQSEEKKNKKIVLGESFFQATSPYGTKLITVSKNGFGSDLGND